MSPTIVHHVVLGAGTSTNEPITVSLYKGGALVGDCGTHPGDYSTQTLSCGEVLADMVQLTLTSTQTTRLYVYEITVSGVLTSTIGG